VKRHSLTSHRRNKHNIQARKYQRCPSEFDRHKFTFIKNLVRTSIRDDIRDGRDGEVNDAHAIAIAVYKRWQTLDHTDDNGGCCSGPCAIALYPHSLFSLTLDRIDDSKPHFVNDTLDNICFTIRGMNTHTSLGKGPDTCARLRAEMHRVIPDEEVIAALEREKQSMNIHVARSFGVEQERVNALYKSVFRAFRHDEKCKKAFGTGKKAFKYCYQLYANANARCNISGIYLSGHAFNRVNVNGKTIPHPFAPSVDAINPVLGHVPGNIRIICCFLNATDMSKQDMHKKKKAQAHGIIPHAWTKELWNHYVGCAN